MNPSRMLHEAERWLETASEDLRAALVLRTGQLFAHACFMAQQCGEKSIKAMWYAIGQEPAGQSIQKLVMQFPEPQKIPDMELWRQHAATLDKFYTATRYPNELPDLTPGSSYFLRDADQAIEYANLFLRAASDWVRALQPAQPSSFSEPVARSTAPPAFNAVEPKIDLSTSAFQAQSPAMLPPRFENTSSGEDHVRRRRSHSWQGRVRQFLARRETWVLVIVLIISAILLGLMISLRVR